MIPITININGQDIVVLKEELTFADVVQAANKPYFPYWTICFSYGKDVRHGILTSTQSVKIKNGTQFTVVMTGSA